MTASHVFTDLNAPGKPMEYYDKEYWECLTAIQDIWRGAETLEPALTQTMNLFAGRFNAAWGGIVLKLEFGNLFHAYGRENLSDEKLEEIRGRMAVRFETAHPGGRGWRFPEANRSLFSPGEAAADAEPVDVSFPIYLRRGGIGLLWFGEADGNRLGDVKRWGPMVAGTIGQGVAAVLDETALDLAKEEKRRSVDLLWGQLTPATLGRLAGSIGHDINNPLAGILGYAELILSENNDPQTLQDVEKIKLNAIRCRDIVQSLLVMARGKEGKPEAMPVRENVDQVLGLMGKALRNANIDVRVEIGPSAEIAHFSSSRFRQALLQVLLNAREAMDKGGKLDLTAAREEKEGEIFIRFDVTDTGPGVPREIQGRFFDPFPSPGKPGHAGIGLAVAKRWIQEGGGEIFLDERSGDGGCRISMRLPASAPRGGE